MRKQLRRKREVKNISVYEMVEKLNISSSFYYKIEQGKRNPTIELAKDIADILDSTVDELFFAQKLDKTSSKCSNLDAMAAK